MTKPRPRTRCNNQPDTDTLFEQANRQWEAGRLKSAFRLFLAGAEAGDSSSQINLGNFYSDGIGVKPDRARALQWYRRAYHRGERAAASNIGILYRTENKLAQALAWFEKAVQLKDGDANVEIAKIYLDRNEPTLAVHYLKRARRAKPCDITGDSREEAERLLQQMSASAKRRR